MQVPLSVQFAVAALVPGAVGYALGSSYVDTYQREVIDFLPVDTERRHKALHLHDKPAMMAMWGFGGIGGAIGMVGARQGAHGALLMGVAMLGAAGGGQVGWGLSQRGS